MQNRNYRDYFIMFCYLSVDSRPKCRKSGPILTIDSMKNVELKRQKNPGVHYLLVKIGNIFL